MRSKSRRYIFLLLFSMAVRAFFYFFPFKGSFFESIANTSILYDVIFYSIMIGLLEMLNERKWLVGLVWVTMLLSIVFGLIEWMRPGYITQHRSVARFMIVMSVVFLVFDVSIFFTRKSPARIFFRLLSEMLTFDLE